MIYSAASRLSAYAARPFAVAGGALHERLALDVLPQATVWVHGASVGELSSAKLLIDTFAARHSVLVTANTTTGRDMARGWGLPARLAPMDAPQVLQRFLGAVRPKLVLTLENELWPGRIGRVRALGAAQVIVGARISERSARRWGRLPWLIGPMLSALDGVSAQDEASLERLLALGLPHEARLPLMQLKLLGPAAEALAARNQVAGNNPTGNTTKPDSRAAGAVTILAASTHPGEDAPILDAFAALRQTHPDLRLILAPRHPDRSDEIAGLMAVRGLDVARRSSGADENAPVLLADTLGEMERWYRAASICLVGGSWAPHGGHTPWEPAAYGCAIIHGPDLSNFAEDYAALAARRAAWQSGADDLADRIAALLDHPRRCHAMGAAARDVLLERAGDPEGLIARIEQILAARLPASNPQHAG